MFVTPAQAYPHCRDPQDDMVIATAVAAHADYLITVDKDLYDDANLVAALADLGIQVTQPGNFPARLQ